MKHVYLNVCSRRSPEWGMIIRVQQAMQHAMQNGISVSLAPRVGESLICRARANSLIDFMDTKCDYLMTLDDDIEIPDNTITKLVQNDKDLCGGFYRLKNDRAAHTAVRMPVERKGEIPDFPQMFKEGLLVPAVYLSTGCKLVRRNVIEKMWKHHTDLHYKQNLTLKQGCALYLPYIYKEEYLSEDWAFCQRALDLGFEVWADASIRCGHWGLIKYDFEEVKNADVRTNGAYPIT